MPNAGQSVTHAQRRALHAVERGECWSGDVSPIGVRADVLIRLEEAGLVEVAWDLAPIGRVERRWPVVLTVAGKDALRRLARHEDAEPDFGTE
jgi:hypothetical protein